MSMEIPREYEDGFAAWYEALSAEDVRAYENGYRDGYDDNTSDDRYNEDDPIYMAGFWDGNDAANGY